MTSAVSWQNSVSLWPSSFCTTRPNFHVTPSVSWLSTFAFQSPIMKMTYFWVLFLEALVGLHRTIQLQLLQHYWSGHRLGLVWYWMVCLENEQRSYYHFWDCILALHFRLLVTMIAMPFLLRTWIWKISGRQWKTSGPGVESFGWQRVGHTLSVEQQNNKNIQIILFWKLSLQILQNI